MELKDASETLQAVRLQELRWSLELKPFHKVLYSLNKLKTLAPPPLPGRWCAALVWLFALAYVGFMGLFVVLFGIRRGEGVSWSWITTVLIQVGKELFISGPMTVLLVNTFVPRYIRPIVSKIQAQDPMPDMDHRRGKLRVRVANAFKRDVEVRLAAAKSLVASNEFEHIPCEHIATIFGVPAKRWQQHLRSERGEGKASGPQLNAFGRPIAIPGVPNISELPRLSDGRVVSPLKEETAKQVPQALQRYAVGEADDGLVVFDVLSQREPLGGRSKTPPMPTGRDERGLPPMKAYIHL